MSYPENCSDFCLFCYKTIKLPRTSYNGYEAVSKFVKFLTRIVGDVSGENKLQPNFDRTLHKLCSKCELNINSFCGLYHKITCLEMQLDLKLNKIMEEIQSSDRIPARWTNINNALQLQFQNDSTKIKESQNEIRKIRHKIMNSGLRRLSTSQPRVSLERCDKGTNISTNETSIDWNILSDEAMPSSLPNLTRWEGDQINSHTGIAQAEVTHESTTISTTTIIKTDPFIEVKEEYPQIEICGNDEWITEPRIGNGGNSERIRFDGETNEMSEDSLDAGLSNKLSIASSLSVEKVTINETSSQTTSGYRTKCACLLCGTIFRDSWNLKRHMMLVHKQKIGTNWKCEKCNKSFIDKWYLTHHLKTCGLPKQVISCRPACPECGKQFRFKWHVTRHMIVHKKDKASIHRENDEPLISVPEETSKRKKSAASSRQFCGKGSKRGEQQAIKINNFFEDAVNVVYTTIPKTTSKELMDPLEISPDEIIEIKNETK